MAVVIETTVGDLTVDLFLEERPRACLNFLKLCRLKYYNFNLFHTIQHGFIAQTGDPTGAGDGGQSIWGVLDGQSKRYFQAETLPKIRHSEPGLLSLVSLTDNMIGSQFFFTLGTDLTSLDGNHCVIGQVTEGHDILRILNEAICDGTHRPYQDIRITHTVILEDPFENPRGWREPSRSPSPSVERLRNGRIGADEDIDDTAGKTEQEIHELLQEREAKARATILEIVGDLPDADVAPPENVLFVCKLNPVTTDDDLEIIFSRFGVIKGCEVIRDRVTGDSLQYAFVEFDDQKACESAYFKMDNVLIDDRRIHVDFSQSVAKVQWKGKGRGLVFADGANKLNFSNYKRKNYDEQHRDTQRHQSTQRRDDDRFKQTSGASSKNHSNYKSRSPTNRHKDKRRNRDDRDGRSSRNNDEYYRSTQYSMSSKREDYSSSRKGYSNEERSISHQSRYDSSRIQYRARTNYQTKYQKSSNDRNRNEQFNDRHRSHSPQTSRHKPTAADHSTEKYVDNAINLKLDKLKKKRKRKHSSTSTSTSASSSSSSSSQSTSSSTSSSSDDDTKKRRKKGKKTKMKSKRKHDQKGGRQ